MGYGKQRERGQVMGSAVFCPKCGFGLWFVSQEDSVLVLKCRFCHTRLALASDVGSLVAYVLVVPGAEPVHVDPVAAGQ